MITTNTKGVGKNRNICLIFADAEYILFADDDVKYDDGVMEAVLKAFSDIPKADVIAFGISY